jgi:hypothetical protein
MDVLLGQVRELVAKADGDGRRKAAAALREMANSLDQPHEAMLRILFGVCLCAFMSWLCRVLWFLFCVFGHVAGHCTLMNSCKLGIQSLAHDSFLISSPSKYLSLSLPLVAISSSSKYSRKASIHWLSPIYPRRHAPTLYY